MGSVDWQLNKAPLECTKYLFENEVNCDVNFRIGEDPENIKAHKLILSMRSPVFDRMFNGRFQESNEDPVIPDVTVEAFEALLRYCYYECLDVEDDMALPVLYASTKYMLPRLEKAARNKLKQTLSQSNIWDIYGYAISVGDTELRNACRTYFRGNVTPVEKALQTEAFLNIPHEVLLDFLHINDRADAVHSLSERPQTGEIVIRKQCNASNSDDITHGLTVFQDKMMRSMTGIQDQMIARQKLHYRNNFGISISDIKLFKACNAWAEAECLQQEIDPTGANMRTVLGEAVLLIRFPTMLQMDLANIVYPTGILTPEEMVDLGQYVHREPGSECQVDFPSSERHFVVTAPEICEIVPRSSTVFIETGERVMLSRVWTDGPGSYRVIVRNERSEVSSSMRCDTEYHGHHIRGQKSHEGYRLYFCDVKPQLLESQTKYSVTLKQAKIPSDDLPSIRTCIMMGRLSPLKEIKISKSPGRDNSIYALTLCLV